MNAQCPFLETIPTLDWGERPEWLTTAYTQAEKARRIITPEFWNSDYPFREDYYKEIGFPFSIGFATSKSRNDILRSRDFEDIATKQYRRNFGISAVECGNREYGQTFKPEQVYLATLCRQIVAADRLIYDQPAVSVDIAADIAQLDAGQAHRALDGIGCGEQPFHTDERLDRLDVVRPMAEAFRKGEKYFCPDSVMGQKVRGVTRIYAVASAYSTEFPNRNPFERWEVFHFIAERHRSPVLPEAMRRFFLRFYICPV